ncbi:MAG: toxin-activating lysine-acyltransferase [Paracoccaceae bacterium]
MTKADNQFLRATRKHFEALRRTGPGPDAGAEPFPDDWFDLMPGVYADFGAMFYLASMTAFHRSRTLATAVSTLEPALRLGQYHIFRSNGFPRAFVTWAGLDPQGERRFAIDHQPIAPEAWNSGPSVWLVDFVAPFGHFDQIVPKLTANPDLRRLRALWHDETGEGYRVMEWSREGMDGPIAQRSFTPAEFAARLAEG